MNKFASYFKFNSLTFWAGAILVLSGALEILGGSIPYLTDVARPIIAAAFNATDPGTRMTLGMGLIGVKRAIAEMTVS